MEETRHLSKNIYTSERYQVNGAYQHSTPKHRTEEEQGGETSPGNLYCMYEASSKILYYAESSR
jgi:hypothetical protein